MRRHEHVIAALRQLRPELTPSTELFPSGTTWIDVRLAEETLVIECSPDGTFGMSLVPDRASHFGGHDSEYRSIEELLAAISAVLVQR